MENIICCLRPSLPRGTPVGSYWDKMREKYCNPPIADTLSRRLQSTPCDLNESQAGTRLGARSRDLILGASWCLVTTQFTLNSKVKQCARNDTASRQIPTEP
ncbi:hypothetical protein NDU88_010319 [Pleurodeles waltl]|uniref:Uncharacterized protein n=1 Tax=Pleurodeles waltl TaxID=8319 RepID=A0AAV7QX57_PLEWA|nr:hypothetical protein NDU88_010319 [Pleurodeles waltl]